MSPLVGEGVWPALPLESWRETKDTLHRYCQMIGKVRLALAPFANHWWHVTLHVTVDGLTTGMLPVGDGRTIEVRLDLREHAVRVVDSRGEVERFALLPRFACARFHDELLAALGRLSVSVDVDMTTYDLDGPAFHEDHDHEIYAGDAVARFAQVMRSQASGTAILPYDTVRTADDPRTTLLGFFEDAYLAGARTADWDLDGLATRAAPRRTKSHAVPHVVARPYGAP